VTTFDPEAPLPGAPDPWLGSSMPAWRDGAPYAMTEMIAAEPALASRLVARLAADPALERLVFAVRAASSVTVAGCGTSEHAAMGIAALLRASGVRAAAGPAMDALLDPSDGLLIGVSHEGGTKVTNAALAAASERGATTALVTVSDRSPGAALVDLTITTDEQDQSWAHTVGYLSPLLVGAVLAARLRGEVLDAARIRALVEPADAVVSAAEEAAAALAGATRIVVAGTGPDQVSARELALKLEEACHLPAVAREVETLLHGHLAAFDAQTAIVLIVSDLPNRSALLERAVTEGRSAAELGTPVIGLLGADAAAAIGSVLAHVPLVAADGVEPATSALLGAALPLQLLAERLARARGVNPDTIGREDPRQMAAASV
jgi:glucosamine--fructose-6-phosphate aminotransferase (isomerizing)